ncbi:hypothetical protein HAX54_019144 [Datura stramonium]|uniref:Kinesin motor domain-containing protein n=1 Tax=Datura stramonium TaxID=4076 RepID=A0ABS8UQL2_DATST|nr:hypothetical protein [Datura stramonium]
MHHLNKPRKELTISTYRGLGILFFNTSFRMLRDFKFLRRNSGKNTQPEEIENVPVNPRDSMGPPTSTDSTRPPLNTIQETTRNLKGGVDQQGGVRVPKIDKTPTKPKASRYSDITRTPEKPLSLPKGRYGWAQKSDSSSNSVEVGDEGKADAGTCGGQSRTVAVNATPRSTRTIGRANSNYSESHSNQTTPSKSVTKPPNPAFSLASGSRPLATGATRIANYAALYRGVPISGNSSNVSDTVEVPHFDLKENPSFWLEHNVQVLIRVRPLNSMEKSIQGYNRCLKQESAQCITWIGQPETRFTFDHVACETINQETLFRMVGLPMVENCLSGYNSSIFAYGQTGSGKTHTMLGEIEELEIRPSPNRGMTPRIFEFLFARIKAEEESRRDERLQYSCKCSFLEIYNEQITDLLDPSSTNLMLREDITKGVYVENLSEFEVQTVGDILKLLTQGSLNRKVAATNMNRESSRSHSVFTCIIESRWEKNSTDNFRFSRLNLVDLAGSERQKASGAEGERLKEAASINRSLSTLGHVIMVLVDVANGRPRHVPYRDSKLTFLLQDSLGGNSKTMIISNVSPSICCAAETLNTLKFAQRAKLIQNNAVVNEDSSADVTALKHEIRLLKEELSSLKRQNVSRALSFDQTTISGDSRLDSSYDEKALETDQHGSLITEEAKGIVRLSSKQFKSLETTLAGSLRREQMAETSIKQLEAEIEQLNRLVRQREEDSRCTKMMLKFREDRIQRMESLVNGLIPADSYLLEENSALTEEIQLLHAKVDRNPEVTRFACENIRLLEELRRFQDFYEEGEREILLSEVSNLRDQLLNNIDGNLKQRSHLDMNIPSQESVHVCDEQTTLHLELKKTLHELEECRTNLNCCLEKNEKLSREIDELRSSLNSISSVDNDHNGGVEVLKESISEALALNSKSKTSDEKEKEDTRKEEMMKHIEEIMDLQLELDILKVIVQEERLHRNELEQRAESMMQDLDSSKEQLLLVTKKCEDVHAELGEAKSIIEALESQHLLAITEVEDLRNSNSHYAEVVQKQELEISSLKEQMFHQASRDLSSSKLLEKAAAGLNVENGLLNHGLSESNSLISKLKEQNFKAQKELDMCRTLKGKLLADIKNNFDRVLRKESDAGDPTSKLGSFEKKILDLQFQEKSMLARSEQMGSELVELIKEIDLSNKTVLASLIDQERVLKDKEEALKSLEDSLTTEFSAKEFESLILSSELEERTILISELERKNKHFYEVVEGLKREIIFDNLDVALTASILLDKEVEVSILQEEVAEAGRKQENLLAELSVMDSMIAKVHSRKHALEQDVCSLMEVSCLNETLKCEISELMEKKTVLTTQVQELSTKNEKLLVELQKKDSALEGSSSRIFDLDQQNQMLQNEICLLEAASCTLQNDMEVKEAEIKKMNCLEKEVEELQHEITELKGERCLLLQELEVKKADIESRNLQPQIERIKALVEENTSLRIQLRSRENGNNATFDMVLKLDSIGSKALYAFQNKSAELDAMLQNIYEEVERASKFFEEFESLENFAEEILLQSASLQTELVRKDDIIKGMLFDLSLLQESASNHKDQKDEIDDLMASINSLENELVEAVCKGQALEVQLQEKISKIAVLESDISQKCKDIELLSSKNSELATIAKDTMEKKCSIEEELLEKREVCENLEIEITNFGDIVSEMSNSIECLKRNLNGVTSEKEGLHGEILTLKKELETAQTLAEESEAIATEAKEAAEIAKLQVEEKEEEVNLLERSVEELECTVNVLENEVEFVRGEAERQRLQREELELELHAIKQQMNNVKGSDADMKRHQEEKEKSFQEACQRIQLLEGEIISRDAEIAHFKAHISELNLHAEAQAREYKEKFKALEALAEKVKIDPHPTQAPTLSSSKLEKNSSKPRGSGSPFKCIGIGLVQQLMSERDEEHSAERHRIRELEALASSRQKEIFMLNSKLAAAESMTHDVIRDLLGLKLDMNNYATLLDSHQQVQMLTEMARLRNVDTQFKEHEVLKLRQQLNEFIEERKGWIEEIERKQAEMVAAQIALEKLRQRDHLLTTENEMIKMENVNHKKKVIELEADIKKLSGQQNLQQRIHHHAKIKEENNLLKNQNDDLIVKLRKTESILSRVREELAHFRQTNGRSPYINFDKEQTLENKLKEKEEERLQLAQKLLGLCATVLKSAGIAKPTSEIGISAAEEALEQLKNRLTSLERELEDAKFKNKMTNERIRLSELMPQSSPLRTGENGQISNRGSSSPLTAFDR